MLWIDLNRAAHQLMPENLNELKQFCNVVQNSSTMIWETDKVNNSLGVPNYSHSHVKDFLFHMSVSQNLNQVYSSNKKTAHISCCVLRVREENIIMW